ncbi:MAG: T9SS type B sorting domain-containing protein, partial [Flavobacterium sp.]
NYNITVRDANGCESVAFPVSILTPLVVNPVVSIPVSCTGNDGVINVNTTGGSGNYQYNIDGGAFGAGSAFNAIAAGNHIIGVRDTTTLCEVFVPVNLQAATLVTGFALAKTDVTCNGGTDGTITASFDTPALGVNDNPVYLYSLNGGMPQASNQFTGLAAGTYIVQVVSARGCDATATIDVDEPDQIVVPAPAVVQFGCASGNVSNLATIAVVGVVGGSNTYLNYEFLRNGTRVQFGPSNVYTETVLTGGNYSVNVFDDRGCVGSTTTAINIAPYIELDTVSVAVNRPITCAVLENITVSVTTIGGTASNLQYTLVDRDPTTGALGTLYPSQTNTTGVFTNLPIGDYNITVRNLDTGCEIRAVHFVNNPNTFDLVVNATTDVTCLDDNNGTAPVNNGTATITLVDRLITTAPVNGNDAGPFSYTLQNAAGVTVGSGTVANAGPFTLTGLASGTYTINATLSQTPDCTVVTNFTIAAPATVLDITETHTEITCVTGNNDGSISVAATGGWPGAYQFELVGPTAAQSVAYGTQTVFTGLTAGSYTVNVRDSRGCVNSEIVVLNNPTPIAFTAAASTTLVDCIDDASASIRVTTGPTGGSGSYLYTLIRTDANGAVTTSGPQVANTFTNLGAGSYQVQVTDSWSCSTTSAAMVINEPTRVTAALTLATAKTCTIDARITLTAAGGTAPYEYSSSASFATTTPIVGTSGTFSVPVGTYSYYVRDANGCVSFISNDVKIDEVPALTLDLDIQNARINCNGDASGVIVAVAQGGLGNYVYTLLDSTGNPVTFTVTQTTPGNFTNIPAGNYVVRVVSQDCAAATSNVVNIIEPQVPLTQTHVVTPITCAGERNGRVVITASGGTGIIQYAISTRSDQFFESGVFENLGPGTYTFIVQDQNGCRASMDPVVISDPSSVSATVVPNSQIPEVCAGDADGAFSINIIGGNAPYSVSLNNRNGTYTTGTLSQSQFDFSGLSGNEQIVYIRDANGCESDFTVMLGEPVTLNPQRTIVYDCVNNTQVNSVTITVDASNDPADLDYSLDGSTVFQASNVFSNLSPGTHTVDVRHTNGCIKQVTFVIDQVDPITISLADGGLNEIVATATGGFGNYQFSLNGEPQGNKNSFIIYRSGDYTVTVTDANGCTATATRFFEYIDIKIPNVFTPNGDGNNDTWAPTNTINYKDLNFEVFDRYGRKLGSFREGESWDGKYNGTELPSGDYWYILRLRDVNDPRQFVGHFTLYR